MSAEPQPSECAMKLIEEDPSITVEEAQAVCNLMNTVEGDLGTVLTESQRKTFVTKSLKDLRAKKHSVDLNRKRKMILASKKLRSFEWSLPMDIHAKDYMLVKGVAATEGQFKSMDKFYRDNLAHGAGALSMAAAMGMSKFNVDHYSEEPLPEKYNAKYGIGSEGDCGFLIDADIADNQINGKKISQVEFIGYITNPKVYELIASGQAKGCSVEDMQRRAVCDCGENDKDCGCTIEGSRFVNVGIIVDEVPDSHGTWIAPVTEHDLEAWKLNKKNEIPFHKLDSKHKAHYIQLRLKGRLTKKSLEDYMNEDGSFINGKNSITEYLQEEKELSDIDAKHLADFLYKNPKILSSYQLAGMSGLDLMEWFKHVIIERAVRKNKKHVAPNEDGTCNEGFKLSEDGTMCIEIEARAEPNEDGSCPKGWHLSEDGSQCIEDDVVDAAVETMPVNEDGTCNEGWTLSEDGTQCTREIQESEVETIPVDENGNCPDGWTKSEDGMSCIRNPLVKAETEGDIPMPDENGNCPQGWHTSDDGLTCIQDEPSIIQTSNFKKHSATALLNKGSKSHSTESGVIIEDEHKFEIIDYKTLLPLIRNPEYYGRTIPSRMAEMWRQHLIHALETVEYLQKKTA